MSKDFKITTEEFNEYGIYNRTLSDIDYGLNSETGEWNVPVIEWEDFGGSYRVRYESEEARQKALDSYEADLEMWVKKNRIEKAWEEEKRLKKIEEIKNMKTLGGMFPELETLKQKL